jgi:hypothetical protein
MRPHFVLAVLAVAGTTSLSEAQTSSVTQAQAGKSTLDASPTRSTTLPPWLHIGGQLRARAEEYTGGGFKPDNSDSYLLTRLLLNARVQPTQKISLFAEGMDARGLWKNEAPAGPPFRDNIDLRQLYLQVGADKDIASVRAGRLELGFGDGRLVGALPWANTARTFDGGRLSFVGAAYRVDAFAASVVKVVQDRFDRNVPGNNFYGLYSSFTKLVPRSTAEPFFFWRRQSGLVAEGGARGTMNFGTLGFRGVSKLPANFDYDTQLAAQSGSLAGESIRASAAHAVLGYTLATVTHTPRLFGEYNYASGDANPTDNKRGTFDQLYPTGHEKYGLTDLVGWQNMKHVRGGVDVPIAKGWSATARYNSYWLADARDALYSGGGAPLARSATGVAGTYVGREADIITSAKLRDGLGFSAGVGRLTPGTFLKNTTPGKTYTYPYAMVTWDF